MFARIRFASVGPCYSNCRENGYRCVFFTVDISIKLHEIAGTFCVSLFLLCYPFTVLYYEFPLEFFLPGELNC